MDSAVGMAGASGDLEMNAYKPLIAFDILQSVRLLCDGCRSFTDNLVVGMRPNLARIERYVDESLVLVTALVPLVGYDAAAGIARSAYEGDLTLRAAAVASGLVDAEQFDRIVDAWEMTHPAEHDMPQPVE
jgi:fumarate hydratase, class II